MKIVVLDGYTLNPGDLSWDALGALGELSVYDRTPDDLIVQRISDAPYIYVNKTPMTRETMAQCPSLKFIGVLATGYNVVDVEAAKELGITVCNVPVYGTTAVAQMVFALLLEVCHHVGDHDQAVKQGDWTKSIDFCFSNHPLIELGGKTMGIIGYGRIGQATARLAKAFGMRVIAYDTVEPTNQDDVVRFVSLDELYQSCDVISLHCPLMASTEGMICKDNIDRMKDGVIIINTSRGGLVVEQDMKDALEAGKVYSFAADVVATEPILAYNPLLTAPRTFLTPHIAWAPKEARQRLLTTAVENLEAFMDGKPQNVVNP